MAENLIIWAAIFVDWAAKLGVRFYFFGQLNSFMGSNFSNIKNI
jgi:hypothetical protein